MIVENIAARKGADTVPWWKDWRGQAAAIIASGPSAKHAKVSALRDRMRVVAIKECHELAPWADVVYGCDRMWWRDARGLPDYSGLKVAQAAELKTSFPDIQIIKVRTDKDEILLAEPGVLGSGGNSGFQALNLVAQFGATRILLIGFDMHDREGVHWYGRSNGMGRSNPTELNFPRWRAAFANVAPFFERQGIDVVNASKISDLKCFRRLSVLETLDAWSLR